MMPSRADVCSLKTIVSLSFAITVAATPSQGTSAVLPLSLASDNGLQPEWPPPTTTSTSILNLTTTTTTTTITTTTQPDSVSYWNNGSNENNETSLFQLGDTSDSYNTSSYNLTEVQCEEWQYAQYTLFQTASLFFAIAFLIPHNFKLNMLLMRSVLSCGFLMFTIWGGVTICAPDIFAWNLIFVIINMTHVIYLGYKHFPPRVKPEYVDLYTKIFKPLNMDKNHFKELVKDAELLIIEEGAHYSVEDVTSADERLSILLYGKLRVTCEDAHLHYILPNEFIDSPEWEACPTDSDELFQVTISAVERSQYICWQRRKLQHVLRNKPFLDAVIYNLIGKDITQKLYSLNEHMNPFHQTKLNRCNADLCWQHFPRSFSVDVVHTGTKGHVRSHLWRMHSRRTSSANSDSLADDTQVSKHKVHFHQRRVSNAVVYAANWISENIRRMTPSDSCSESLPLWSRIKQYRSEQHPRYDIDSR